MAERYVIAEDKDDLVWVVIDARNQNLVAKCPTKQLTEQVRTALESFDVGY